MNNDKTKQLCLMTEDGVWKEKYIVSGEHSAEELRVLFREKLTIPIIINEYIMNVEVGNIYNLHDTETIHLGFIVDVGRHIKKSVTGLLRLDNAFPELSYEELEEYIRRRGGISGLRNKIITMMQEILKADTQLHESLTEIHASEKVLEERGLLSNVGFFKEVYKDIIEGAEFTECYKHMEKYRVEMSGEQSGEMTCLIKYKGIQAEFSILIPKSYRDFQQMSDRIGKRELLNVLERDYEEWCEYMEEVAANIAQ